MFYNLHTVFLISLVPFPFQLEQKVEEVELNNSILIEISKTAVSKWQEKLKTRYGWFKSDNCKHLIFDVSHSASENVYVYIVYDIVTLHLYYDLLSLLALGMHGMS